MTLDTNLSKAVYQGNGATTVFPFAFVVWDTAQLVITMTDAVGTSTDVTSQCAIALSGSGGSVTYPVSGDPLPTGAALSITRNMPFTQGVDLVSASRFDPQVIEDALDQAAAERQQTLEMMQRAVILPATSDQSPEDVVAAVYASRDAAANSASSAQSAATAAELSASSAQSTVQTATAAAVSEATAQATAAAASATAAQASADAAAGASEGLAPRMDAVETVAAAAKTVTDTATETPGAGKIPIAGTTGKIDPRWCGTPSRIFESFNTSEPDGLLCNGGAYSRETYADLFAVLGTAFGAGDGSTTFNVPDFRGRTLQGANANLMAVLEAGLPNIAGFTGLVSADGALTGPYYKGASVYGVTGVSYSTNPGVFFDPSRVSSIYGAAATVQSPAIAVNIFIKY